MSKKFTIASSLAITEDLVVKNLTVSGTTTTENQETLSVKDNLIITNAEGVDIQTLLSGLVIRKDSLSAYGIVYDPTDDAVKLGLGSIVNNEFQFSSGEGLPVVVRGDLVDGNLIQFSATGHKVVDAGKKITDLLDITSDQTITGAKTFNSKVIVDELEVLSDDAVGTSLSILNAKNGLTVSTTTSELGSHTARYSYNGVIYNGFSLAFPQKSGNFALTSDVDVEASARARADAALQEQVTTLQEQLAAITVATEDDIKTIFNEEA